MTKYKFTVLFKNGIEKEFEASSDDAAMENLIATIDSAYKGRGKGVLQLGGVLININETVCIEITPLSEEVVINEDSKC